MTKSVGLLPGQTAETGLEVPNFHCSEGLLCWERFFRSRSFEMTPATRRHGDTATRPSHFRAVSGSRGVCAAPPGARSAPTSDKRKRKRSRPAPSCPPRSSVSPGRLQVWSGRELASGQHSESSALVISGRLAPNQCDVRPTA